uniref:Uncharacterized protein n=1 Tax=Acrobeloides nanus TaxID=290746 RepID=A0A914DXA8_9BILA
MSKQLKLSGFFKCNKSASVSDLSEASSSHDQPLLPSTSEPDLLEASMRKDNSEKEAGKAIDENIVEESHFHDIGRAVYYGRGGLDDEEKLQFLTNAFKPTREYKLPSVKDSSGKIRGLRHEHLDEPEFEWISFSSIYNGLFCR